jgi:glutathione S-transferase
VGPFLAGEQLNVADLKLFVILRACLNGTYDYIDAAMFDAWPPLVALHGAVEAHPAIQGYYFSGR